MYLSEPYRSSHYIRDCVALTQSDTVEPTKNYLSGDSSNPRGCIKSLQRPRGEPIKSDIGNKRESIFVTKMSYYRHSLLGDFERSACCAPSSQKLESSCIGERAKLWLN